LFHYKLVSCLFCLTNVMEMLQKSTPPLLPASCQESIIARSWCRNFRCSLQPQPTLVNRKSAANPIWIHFALCIFQHYVMKDATCNKNLVADFNITKAHAVVQQTPALLQNSKQTLNIFANTFQVCGEVSLWA